MHASGVQVRGGTTRKVVSGNCREQLGDYGDQETDAPLDSGLLAHQREWQLQVIVGCMRGPYHYLLADPFIGIAHEIVRPVLVRIGFWSINYPWIGYSGTQV